MRGQKGCLPFGGRIFTVGWRFKKGRIGGIVAFTERLRGRFLNLEGFFAGFRSRGNAEEYRAILRFKQPFGSRVIVDFSFFSISGEGVPVDGSVMDGRFGFEGVSEIEVVCRNGGTKKPFYKKWVLNIATEYEQVTWDRWSCRMLGLSGILWDARVASKESAGDDSNRGEFLVGDSRLRLMSVGRFGDASDALRIKRQMCLCRIMKPRKLSCGC